MKKLLLVFLMSPMLCFAKWQRVIVTKMEAHADSGGNSITCFAFCIDAVRLWAPDSTNFPYVYSGANTTLITLSVNQKIIHLTLAKALSKKYISIISYMPRNGDYKGRIKILCKSGKKIKLLGISTKGFAAGADNEATTILPELYERHVEQGKWKKVQNDIIETQLTCDYSTPAGRMKVLEDYVQVRINGCYRFDGKTAYYQSAKRKTSWQVKIENDTIKVFEPILKHEAFNFSDLYHSPGIGKDVCISGGEKGFKILFSGTLENVFPVRVEYSSNGVLMATAFVKDSTTESEKDNDVDLILTDEKVAFIPPSKSDSGATRCNIKMKGLFCFPGDFTKQPLEMCGRKVYFNGVDLYFRF